MTEPTPRPGNRGRGRPPSLARRLAAVASFGIAAAATALAYRHFWYARPMGAGPAGPAVPAERFENDLSTWSDRNVLLIGIGDSMTAGYGASPRMGYFDRLVSNPPDDFSDVQGKCLSQVLPHLTYRNLALAGASSQECLDVLVPKLGLQDEDIFGVVVMTVGGNDIIHDYGRAPPREGAMYGATLDQARPWIENFRTRLDAILDQTEAKFPGGCVFFVGNIYDPTDGVGDAANAGLPPWPDGLKIIDAYNGIIAQAADLRKNVELVDIRGAFLGHGIHCLKFWQAHYVAGDPHYWYGDKLESPNDRGYDVVRRLFLTEMARRLPALLEDGD